MNLLASQTGRRLLFGALYFSEGAPIGYVWWALPTKLREAGVPVEQVTQLTALLVLPWALKFLWAPLVDTLRGPRWDRRRWIISAQIGMGLALLPLVGLSLHAHLPLITALLLVHAVLAATQDVGVDALCIATLPPAQRGSINGWMQLGMLLGRALFGGAVLAIESYLGAPATIGLLIACIWGSTVLLLCSHPAPEILPGTRPAAMWRAFGTRLLHVLRARRTWLGLAFALTGGAAFEAVGSVAGPLLIDMGRTQEGVGLFFAGPVVACMAGGALAGGWLADRCGRRRTVVVLGLLVAATVATLAALLHWHAPVVVLSLGLMGLYLLIGAFTAATYALFMDLTDPALGATQFSAFMAATNLCEAWAGFTVGRLIAAWGYPGAFLLMAGAGSVALLTLVGLRAYNAEAPSAGRE